MPSLYERIYAAINDIPKGRVATYGQIARLAGLGGDARQVGYALSALPEGTPVPWHRVINAQGGISPRADPQYEKRQRRMLEDEGVVFGPNGRVPLKRFQWNPHPDSPGRPEDGPPLFGREED